MTYDFKNDKNQYLLKKSYFVVYFFLNRVNFLHYFQRPQINLNFY